MEKLENSTNIPFSYANKQALSSQQHAFQVTTHFSVSAQQKNSS
jgi:hypothetical protein